MELSQKNGRVLRTSDISGLLDLSPASSGIVTGMETEATLDKSAEMCCIDTFLFGLGHTAFNTAVCRHHGI
jgi:hypothetical protein